jgi:hypothetical protein
MKSWSGCRGGAVVFDEGGAKTDTMLDCATGVGRTRRKLKVRNVVDVARINGRNHTGKGIIS